MRSPGGSRTRSEDSGRSARLLTATSHSRLWTGGMPVVELVEPPVLAAVPAGWAAVPVEAGRLVPAVWATVAGAALGAAGLDRMACPLGRRSGDRTRHERAISGPAV